MFSKMTTQKSVLLSAFASLFLLTGCLGDDTDIPDKFTFKAEIKDVDGNIKHTTILQCTPEKMRKGNCRTLEKIDGQQLTFRIDQNPLDAEYQRPGWGRLLIQYGFYTQKIDIERDFNGPKMEFKRRDGNWYFNFDEFIKHTEHWNNRGYPLILSKQVKTFTDPATGIVKQLWKHKEKGWVYTKHLTTEERKSKKYGRARSVLIKAPVSSHTFRLNLHMINGWIKPSA